MTKRHVPLVICAFTAVLAGGPASAQQPGAPAVVPPVLTVPEPDAAKPIVPLDIQILVSRFRGEKKVSSVPFSLAVNTNEGVSQLRMNANVPVPAIVAPKGNATGTTGTLPGPLNYKDIGTAIDCHAKSLADGRFQVFVSVEDLSVYTDVEGGAAPAIQDMPVFRSFKSKNTVVLKDGQSRQFTAATDRVNGEVVKIDVTLKVVK